MSHDHVDEGPPDGDPITNIWRGAFTLDIYLAMAMWKPEFKMKAADCDVTV